MPETRPQVATHPRSDTTACSHRHTSGSIPSTQIVRQSTRPMGVPHPAGLADDMAAERQRTNIVIPANRHTFRPIQITYNIVNIDKAAALGRVAASFCV